MRTLLPVLLLLVLLTLPGARAQALSVTRGDFVIALWESAGGVPYDATPVFSDVELDDRWATAVGWAAAQGLVRGTGDGRFEPARPITREEAAVLLRRWWALLGRDTFLPDGVAECNDYMDISPWADDSLYWATDAGLLDWSSGGRLDPRGLVAAEELPVILERLASPPA